ncbi:MAG: CDP-diacylglycerol--glycerol-3-phosphate 3-phosphatidyltransferase [Actinomycetota bacterium]
MSQPPAARVLSAVTYLRILLVPAAMALILAGARLRYAYVGAAALFALAAFTDFLDGYLARRWQATSSLGSFLDTTADKLLVSGVLITLVAVGRVSPWIAAIIVGRELAILGLRGVVAMGGAPFHPSIWGKLKTNAQFVGIILAIARYPHRLGPLFFDEWVMLAAAAATVMSAVEYLTRFSEALTGRRAP